MRFVTTKKLFLENCSKPSNHLPTQQYKQFNSPHRLDTHFQPIVCINFSDKRFSQNHRIYWTNTFCLYGAMQMLSGCLECRTQRLSNWAVAIWCVCTASDGPLEPYSYRLYRMSVIWRCWIDAFWFCIFPCNRWIGTTSMDHRDHLNCLIVRSLHISIRNVDVTILSPAGNWIG